MKPITVNELIRFTKQKAAVITNNETNLIIKDLSNVLKKQEYKSKRFSKNGNERFRLGQLRRIDGGDQIYYMVELDLSEFRRQRYTNPNALKNIILHELSHIPEYELGKTPTHGRSFKETATKLGVPRTHKQAHWDMGG